MKSTPLLVVLAAGRSERLGRDKATAPLSDDPGDTALARILAAGSRATSGTLVVVAPETDLTACPLPENAEKIVNPSPEAGRTGSVQCAARARPGVDFLIAPVDVPGVRASTFAALVEAWRTAELPARGWLAPRHGGLHGHPVVLGRELVRELVSLDPAVSLRRSRRGADPLLEIVVDDPGILDDLDHPSDLDELRSRAGPGE